MSSRNSSSLYLRTFHSNDNNLPVIDYIDEIQSVTSASMANNRNIADITMERNKTQNGCDTDDHGPQGPLLLFVISLSNLTTIDFSGISEIGALDKLAASVPTTELSHGFGSQSQDRMNDSGSFERIILA